MNKGKIGVQLNTLRNEIAQIGLYEALKQVSAMGFTAIEVSWLPMTPENIAQLQRAVTDFGLEVAALGCGLQDISPEIKYPGDTLQNNFDKIVADCKTIGCSIVRIGSMPLAYCASPEGMLRCGEIMETYAARLAKHGIELHFHGHSFEFYRLDGIPITTHIRNRTKHLKFELDTHWMWRGGVDPVKYLAECSGRASILFLKDYKIGLLDTSIKWKLGEEHNMFGSIEQFAEVGEGVLDFPAIIPAGLNAGIQYFLLEQDETYGKSAFDSLAVSRDNLIRMGYGDWF